MTLWESFKKMSVADQREFMTLYDKYDNIQALPSDMKKDVEKELTKVKSKIYKTSKVRANLLLGIQKTKRFKTRFIFGLQPLSFRPNFRTVEYV